MNRGVVLCVATTFVLVSSTASRAEDKMTLTLNYLAQPAGRIS